LLDLAQPAPLHNLLQPSIFAGVAFNLASEVSEKLLRNMEKELEIGSVFCYNTVKSQKGLDCKQERSIE